MEVQVESPQLIGDRRREGYEKPDQSRQRDREHGKRGQTARPASTPEPSHGWDQEGAEHERGEHRQHDDPELSQGEYHEGCRKGQPDQPPRLNPGSLERHLRFALLAHRRGR